MTGLVCYIIRLISRMVGRCMHSRRRSVCVTIPSRTSTSFCSCISRIFAIPGGPQVALFRGVGPGGVMAAVGLHYSVIVQDKIHLHCPENIGLCLDR